jgi:hypothetical protein
VLWQGAQELNAAAELCLRAGLVLIAAVPALDETARARLPGAIVLEASAVDPDVIDGKIAL